VPVYKGTHLASLMPLAVASALRVRLPPQAFKCFTAVPVGLPWAQGGIMMDSKSQGLFQAVKTCTTSRGPSVHPSTPPAGTLSVDVAFAPPARSRAAWRCSWASTARRGAPWVSRPPPPRWPSVRGSQVRGTVDHPPAPKVTRPTADMRYAVWCHLHRRPRGPRLHQSDSVSD